MHIEDDRLQDFVDGLLGGDEQAELERHLVECELCLRATRSQRALLDQLTALPRSIAPVRDLRPRIHAVIAAGPVHGPRTGLGARTLWSSRHLLAAAAMVLIALSAAVTAVVIRGGARTTSAAVLDAAPLPGMAPADFNMLEANYVAATDELSRLLYAQRASLAPETVRILEENLAIIDAALAEARAALRADPRNHALSVMVVAAFEKKLNLLRRATEAPFTRSGV